MLKRINKKQLIFVSLIAVMLFLTWSFTTLITRAYDRFSDTGVQLDNTRTLTIKSKNVANAFDTFSESSLNFETSARAESLPAVTTKQVKFKITKLLPASGYKEVLPRVEASYVKSTASIYVSNNVGAGYGDIKLLFNGPYNIENDLPNTKGNNQTKGAVLFDLDGSNHSYGFISTDDGATYSEFDNGSSSQRAQLNKFLSGNSVDGAYMIELIDSLTNQWKTIVEIPTIKNSDSEFRNYFNNFGLTEHINYDPIVYAKVKDKQKTMFNSYANTFAYTYTDYGGGKTNHKIAYAPYFRVSTASSLTGLQHTGAFHSGYVSTPRLLASKRLTLGTKAGISSVTAFPDTLTATINITNLSDYPADQVFRLGMFINDGVDTVLQGTDWPNKFYGVSKVRPLVIIRNLVKPERSKVFYIKDPSVSIAGIEDDSAALLKYTQTALPDMYSNYNPSSPSILAGKGGNLPTEKAFYFPNGDQFFLKGMLGNLNRDVGVTNEKTIRGYITDYILSNDWEPTTSSILAGGYDTLNNEIVNTAGYTNAAQIYSDESILCVEFGFNAEVTFAGVNFTVGTHYGYNDGGFKPIIIGATNTNYSTLSPIDVTAWGNTKTMGTEAFFTTSQYNGYKVDQNREPLNDAGFAVVPLDHYNYDYELSSTFGIILNRWHTNTSISDIITVSAFLNDFYNAQTPSSISKEYFFTSGDVYTNGAILIQGINPDFEYYLVEIKPPEGYRKIQQVFLTNGSWDIASRNMFVSTPAYYLSWPSQAAVSMNTDFLDLNPYGNAVTPVITFNSISALRMDIFINVPELGLPNTGGIALGIILILGIASVSTGLYVRKRGLKSGLKKLVS